MKSHFLPIIIFSGILLLTCCTENNEPTKNKNTTSTDTTKVVSVDTLPVTLKDSFLVAQLTISTENAAAI
ncbi:MAG TPA: hypothetical protein VFK73_08110, partial [Paludibacter sp.]|nr:hypothetical protein [Paludibacter sp.]